MTRRLLKFGCCLAALALVACGKPNVSERKPVSASATREHRDEPGHAQLPSIVRLSPQVLANARIETKPVRVEQLPGTIDLIGEITPDPDRLVRVAARAQGRVVAVYFKEGDWVKAGTILTVMESPELARARASVTSADARSHASRQNANRVTDLGRKRLASAQEVATAEAEARAAEADALAARQTLSSYGAGAFEFSKNAARLELKAPIDGFALRRDAIVGQTIAPDHVVAVLADLNRAYFMARLFEKDLAEVHAESPAEIRLNAYSGLVMQGKVEQIGRELDADARTVIARILIEGQGNVLKAGLFGTARVSIPNPPNEQPRLVVPLSAVTQISGRDVVFVREPDGDFAVHPVSLGRTASGKVQVVAGLREGEAIAYNGVFTLKSVVLKGTFGEEE